MKKSLRKMFLIRVVFLTIVAIFTLLVWNTSSFAEESGQASDVSKNIIHSSQDIVDLGDKRSSVFLNENVQDLDVNFS